MLTLSEALKSLTWMTKFPLNSVEAGFYSIRAQQEGQFSFREIDWRFVDKKKPCWKWELVIYIQWFSQLWNSHKRNEKKNLKSNQLILKKREEVFGVFLIWLGKKPKTITNETESRKILSME